ncbi:hypothetical protein DEA8626_03210 [Defluviimonas aquaemixtae]|uniref:Uncharacterized protein n=1 Tax=Albidovulum aquaemixtae TaxID=1542388 RepID=A0A2R8BLE8_9RHOB|nr:hypothetical protein [Defluviimonas aquaemixtae]SPH24161.1 hypothetical protein DEA8626_03210 [Defluviimonas aquaemixtae]
MIRRCLPLVLLFAAPAIADTPRIVGAEASRKSDSWAVAVTILHPDTGWDHYANGWEVLAPDGTRLGYRELLHPHVEEQPFTRSLSGVVIPDDADHVLIRPRCTLDGWSGGMTRLELAR